MIITYYPHSKTYGTWIFLKFNVCFYNLKSSKVFYNMQMMCNAHDIQNKVIIYDLKQTKTQRL
jgi:hypothetical protein